MAAGKVEVLLVFSGLEVDKSAEGKLVNIYVNIKEGDIGGRNGQVNQSV
jgi:hypothetical protein